MTRKKILDHYFGNYLIRINNAIYSLYNKQGIIIMDDQHRENESDIIFSAETISIPQIAFAIRYSSGIICLCITENLRKKLELPMMVQNNTSKYQTGFTVTIEAAKGVTTGVSAKDRYTTIKTATAYNAKPTDLHRPGHVFPLRALSGGVLIRPGHTEATIDILKIAHKNPIGILCELTNSNGTMADIYDTINFAKKHNMIVVTVNDIKKYIMKHNIFLYKDII
ncbi:3,4-dihydroxy-2-butanone-4-phosphate synthase [Enterobacteriaceae endosymbiont of Macroplea appendiculata]|uniref:3,4-dihydroxy-2-butanone-4-phosphate synthase n=1 Tax=Enterobacteriaceae endosymbiont of Macroplea appendiculata TaxID=2675790 RepID=UPI001449FA2D|nr:3,4-dihydroxy-2-butanone-4-phosphate synthase [Enterobacteriaceae endosymbiont of Macroplea appendiculata]QJC30852.1 3,4-dihydroxy-2-butanone-4-phosphate synthase [Enterobacteriaceae endosymbiont of Macroplea appendiculata]